MVGNERLGCRPPGDRLHHRGLNFQVVPRNHVIANQGNDPASFPEHVTYILIDHQVQVALAITGLDIGQAVPFFRQGQQ